MRRTKEWWSALIRPEKIWLVYAERNNRSYGSYYLPEDCTECGVCGFPQLGGGGMCTHCYNKRAGIIKRADHYIKHKGECDTCDGRGRLLYRRVWTAEDSIEEIGCDDWAGEIQEWAEDCPVCGGVEK